MKLIQKQGTRRKEFELKGDKLFIKSKSLGEKEEYSIDIELIGEERYYKTHSRTGPGIVAIFFFGTALTTLVAFLIDDDKIENLPILIFALIFGVGFGLLALKAPLRNELHLIGGSANVMFLLNSPSKEEMENFIRELIKCSRHILLEKYGKIDPDLPEETQINNLYWLKNRGIISPEQYEQLKEEYRSRKLLM